ncbi:MAG: adenylate/guanylate cyclase domain-containing protein [Myxococcales bacterium]|nr:adenylate/guanylate cyclase domain-containing protein [Myxococcales bacterium]
MAILDWLTSPEVARLDGAAFIGAVGEHLGELGVPAWRISSSFSSIHPEVAFYNVRWEAGGVAVLGLRSQSIVTSPFYTDSPVARVYQDRIAELRRRLTGPEAQLDFPICRELAELGATDYLVQHLRIGGGRRGYISYATREPGGFPDSALELLRELLAPLSLAVEVRCLEFTMQSLLQVYLGGSASERVLSGAVTRGSGVPIEAAIWYCDLRGFTTLSDRQPAAQVVAILDRYFEVVAGPIDGHGGEILKFIGDAVLAIFPVTTDRGEACRRALAAARAALDGIRALDEPIEMGLALHVGEVLFGNIGARERLDFTAIGAAVNEVCRVEPLCKQLNRSLLLTGAFAQACPDPDFVSLGPHQLRGVASPQEIFAPRS